MGETKKQSNALAIIGVLLGLGILFFAGMSFSRLHSTVKSVCLAAKNEYKKDCVSSLIETVQSEKHSFKERNDAVWALGQIADPQALPFLTELNRSLPERNLGYESGLSKPEVEKAIKWCGKEKTNITSWMYRNRENWR